MLVQHFFVTGLAHSSYLLGGTSSCAIVDPQRDVDVYLAAARALGLTITHILETHLHADFISGHMDLAEKTGAGHAQTAYGIAKGYDNRSHLQQRHAIEPCGKHTSA